MIRKYNKIIWKLLNLLNWDLCKHLLILIKIDEVYKVYRGNSNNKIKINIIYSLFMKLLNKKRNKCNNKIKLMNLNQIILKD